MRRGRILPNNQKGKVMPRKKVMRQELADTGILTNFAGIETARLTLNGLIIINPQELFYSIIHGANKHGEWCPMTYLCQVYGFQGTWGYDISVDGAVRDLDRLGVVTVKMSPSNPRQILAVRPMMSPHEAIKLIPKYTTRAEVIAGLEPLDNE
jgi:hypothetical protein